MKVIAAILLLVLLLVVVGCTNPPDSITDQGAKGKPIEMPTAVGVTAGQSGTGTTSGASTGY